MFSQNELAEKACTLDKHYSSWTVFQKSPLFNRLEIIFHSCLRIATGVFCTYPIPTCYAFKPPLKLRRGLISTQILLKTIAANPSLKNFLSIICNI